MRRLKGSLYIPYSRLAAKKILSFAHSPELLTPYRKNLLATPDTLYNAEASADLIWQRICELGYAEE